MSPALSAWRGHPDLCYGQKLRLPQTPLLNSFPKIALWEGRSAGRKLFGNAAAKRWRERKDVRRAKPWLELILSVKCDVGKNISGVNLRSRSQGHKRNFCQ